MDRRHVPNRRQKILLISFGHTKTPARRLITTTQLQHVHWQAYGPGALFIRRVTPSDYQSYH